MKNSYVLCATNFYRFSDEVLCVPSYRTGKLIKWKCCKVVRGNGLTATSHLARQRGKVEIIKIQLHLHHAHLKHYISIKNQMLCCVNLLKTYTRQVVCLLKITLRLG